MHALVPDTWKRQKLVLSVFRRGNKQCVQNDWVNGSAMGPNIKQLVFVAKNVRGTKIVRPNLTHPCASFLNYAIRPRRNVL